jgi:hypothetical protein
MNTPRDERLGNDPPERVLSEEDQRTIREFKDLEHGFMEALARLQKRRGSPTRPLAIARTDIETGVMWACREITG